MISPDTLFGRLGNRLFQGAYLYAQARQAKIQDVYVQDEKYFKKYKKEIQTWFGQGIGPTIPYVGIHVRRGDYVGNKFHVNLSETNYYEKAIDLFPGKEFLVFSDDPEWCEKNFTSKNFEIVHGDEINDFNQLASCEHQIIANSSFSWWAAYLNPNPAKKVISPLEDRWFHDGLARTRVPKDWTQISYE